MKTGKKLFLLILYAMGFTVSINAGELYNYDKEEKKQLKSSPSVSSKDDTRYDEFKEDVRKLSPEDQNKMLAGLREKLKNSESDSDREYYEQLILILVKEMGE